MSRLLRCPRAAMALFTALAISACTAPPQEPQPPVQHTPAEHRPPEDPAPPPPRPKPAAPTQCPASYSEAGRLQINCDEPAIDSCDYPEGQCSCSAPRQCGGMFMQPILNWGCTATPVAIRPDGCPGILPRGGDPCAPEGKICGYHQCDPSAQCKSGKWQIRHPKQRA